ncbi:glucosamine-6-phosphate deaminase [Solibacillus cecembensis]|uniref:glucosamine-6-phosphate deaminase n=1 Tax=Solibacillus cecembensis TaxID=459347 RepID=UPI003D05193A
MVNQIEVIEDHGQLYARAVEIIAEQLKDGAKVFGLATGGTMLPLYEQIRESDIDFTQCTSFNLDEYVGLAKEHPESYHRYMDEQLFHSKPFKHSFLPDGQTQNSQAEAQRYEALLKGKRQDFQLLGLGENGHIGFNEPGTAFTSETHIVQLQKSTREANARFFNSIDEVPSYAITMGIHSILRAKKILVIALGEKKRAALEALSSGTQTEQIPATSLQNHPNVIVLTDIHIG